MKEKLKSFFDNALVYVSPGPVGLGVLHSFSYGTPVITINSGKHGPELSNIINGVNGYICDDYEDFSNKLNYILNNKKKLKTMSSNAYDHYINKRNNGIMVSAFIDALKLKL